jgi:hypothetical protein
MKRITALHGTKENFKQCVITEESKPYFAALGFVFKDSDLSDSEKGSKRESELRDSIRLLGGKPASRSSITTLEKQLSDLEGLADDNQQD